MSGLTFFFFFLLSFFLYSLSLSTTLSDYVTGSLMVFTIIITLSIMSQVAATSDLMLAYMDFFLGGDEKRSDLPPRLHQRFPMSIIFGGDGSYTSPFSLHSDNILTSIMSQVCSDSKFCFYVKC